MEKAHWHPFLVVSGKWQTRALLAAQIAALTERDVVSASDVSEALGLIKLGGIDPVLLVVDAGEEIGREDVERVMEAEEGVPLVVIVSRLRGESFDSLRDRCAAYLLRPITVGGVARAVRKVLEELQQISHAPVSP
jgi:DNA-binding NtrC family response regulator